MKQLITMTDFVLEDNGIHEVVKYAKFLKQPLELWMFTDKERCLFENHDLTVETIKRHINLGRTVEYFASFETLQLTPTALKQIGL